MSQERELTLKLKKKHAKLLGTIGILIIASFAVVTTWGLLIDIQLSQQEIILLQNNLVTLQEQIITLLETKQLNSELGLDFPYEIHLDMYHWRPYPNLDEEQLTEANSKLSLVGLWKFWEDTNLNGKPDFPTEYYFLLAHSHHQGTLTDIGKEWIEAKLGSSGHANNTDYATYIANSNDTTSPSSTWTTIPNEITTGGMERVNGTYVSTGTGTWNMSNTFSPTESNSTRLVGLYHQSTGAALVASDTITAINYASGDSVEEVWSMTVS